ncbi:O-antigen polymerase [Neobacillus thermocopriae]|nr:O-antigen polymerase [Neobacillus thermocopriae]
MTEQWEKYLKIERDEQEDQLEMQKVDRLLWIGLLLVLFLVPVVVRVGVIDYAAPFTGSDILDTGKKAELFTYYKYKLLVISTIVLTGIFLYKVIVLKYEIPKSSIYVFLALFSLMIVLSTIFAPYKLLALHGMYNRHDGALANICFLTLLFIASNIRYSTKMMVGILYALYPFVMLNTLLGLLNFYGYNVLQVPFVYDIVNSGMSEGAEIDEGSRLWGTVNHGNYVSGVSAFLIVLFFTWALLDKNKVRSAVNVMVALLCFAMLLSSLSVSGFLTFTLILPLIFLLIFKVAYKRKFAITFTAFLAGATCIYVVMVNHNPRVWDETFGFFIKTNPFAEAHAMMDGLRQAFDPSHVYAESEHNQQDQAYELPQLPESGVGSGSGRLYIWKKTWELIQQRPLLGYGLDTLPYFFPQDDPEKHANIETYTVIVDKPHNLYIGIAYGAGVIALFALIAFVANIAILAMKRIAKTMFGDDEQAIFASIALACSAYLVQALFNDSIIGTAVIFWILLGVLVSFLVQQKKEKVS